MKKIKNILCLFLGICFFLFSCAVFADSNIRLNVDKQELDIQEILELRIDIQLEDQTNSVQIEIPGIEDFMILGESQSQSTTSINGVTSQNFVLVLNLKGREAGNYEIGPIIIGDVQSDTQTIEITGEQLFIGGQVNTDEQLTREEIDKKARQIAEQVQEQYQKQLEEENNKQIIEENALAEAHQEFKDIKKLSHVSPLHGKDSLMVLLFFGLIFIAYKVYTHFLANLQQRQAEQTEVISEVIQKQTDFQSLLHDIEIHSIDIEKEAFYGKLGGLMRTYFDEKIKNGLSSKTFGELRKEIKKYPSLTHTYEKIYFPEYNLEKDTPEQRIEIINILKDELI